MARLPISDDAQAFTALDNVSKALDQLVVSGRENCFAIVAMSNDLDRVKQFLRDRLTRDTQGAEA